MKIRQCTQFFSDLCSAKTQQRTILFINYTRNVHKILVTLWFEHFIYGFKIFKRISNFTTNGKIKYYFKIFLKQRSFKRVLGDRLNTNISYHDLERNYHVKKFGYWPMILLETYFGITSGNTIVKLNLTLGGRILRYLYRSFP